jgi:hypothetical protein
MVKFGAIPSAMVTGPVQQNRNVLALCNLSIPVVHQLLLSWHALHPVDTPLPCWLHLHPRPHADSTTGCLLTSLQDCTTNPSLCYQAVQDHEYQGFLQQALKAKAAKSSDPARPYAGAATFIV